MSVSESKTAGGHSPASPASGQREVTYATMGIVLCILSMFSVQIGAALSKSVMQDLGSFGTTWLRLCIAAVALNLIVRPRVRTYERRHWLAAAALGGSMATMTLCFFAAIERIPLGLAVAIDFLGPLTIATLYGIGRLRFLCPVIAAAGVLCLAWDGTTWPGEIIGVVLAMGAAVGWGGYVLLMKHVGQLFSGLEGLAVSLAFAGAMATPLGLPEVGPGITLELAVITALLAFLVPLLPYALEYVALRRMRAAAFGILMSLEPAIAAVTGSIILGQSLTSGQFFGVALVVAASAAGALINSG
ncbi:EamA family transporter [Neorhizobium sp. NPDC001467]|uniref:EamA family transporter n=1 Tax=Neorhizobium sp. NPDC001467 TaxID=3390595 RepID=UPI003CFE82CD